MNTKATTMHGHVPSAPENMTWGINHTQHLPMYTEPPPAPVSWGGAMPGHGFLSPSPAFPSPGKDAYCCCSSLLRALCLLVASVGEGEPDCMFILPSVHPAVVRSQGCHLLQNKSVSIPCPLIGWQMILSKWSCMLKCSSSSWGLTS